MITRYLQKIVGTSTRETGSALKPTIGISRAYHGLSKKFLPRYKGDCGSVGPGVKCICSIVKAGDEDENEELLINVRQLILLRQNLPT